jgi:putative toxin-antitoxin system antitoxin component (TIGR02293 family)
MSILPDVAKVSATLGLSPGVKTPTELDRVVRKGLPYSSALRLARQYPERERARLLQIIAPRQTLQRREQEGRFRPDESERLERLARLTELARFVWEVDEGAQEFMTTPHPLLDDEIPLELAATDLGARRVEALLWKLEYSLPV